jgi:hypothetical protein
MGQPDGRAGRTLPGRVPRLCVLSQYEWLSDGSGLAYVRICPDGQNGDHQATLFSVLLSRSAPRQLYRALSIDQQVVDLAPVFRCVACGG